MTKKKKRNPQLSLKEQLIDEAQKMIAVADIDRNHVYCFVKRNNNLSFCCTKTLQDKEKPVLSISGFKISTGLEEYQWDVYGDLLLTAFLPKQIECTENSIDESATEPTDKPPQANMVDRKKPTIPECIKLVQCLCDQITFAAGIDHYLVKRDENLYIIEHKNCLETDSLLMCLIGTIMAKGLSRAQWTTTGHVIQAHFWGENK